MFHANKLPNSLVDDVAKILGETNSDYALPAALQEKVAKAAGECMACITREDRRTICENYLVEAYGDELSDEHRANFHAAVEYAMHRGNYEISSPAPSAKVLSEKTETGDAPEVKKNRLTSKTAKGLQAAKNLNKKNELKEETEISEIDTNNQEILDIMESLNDDEFGALLELLNDEQLANLEALLDNGTDE